MKHFKHVKLLQIFIIGIFLLGVVFLSLIDNIGVSKNNVEADARKSEKIDDSWQVSKCISDDIIAMIFYSENKKEHKFSIYIKRPNSWGYFFRIGGSDTGIEEFIRCYEFDNIASRAFISMNSAKVSKVIFNEEVIKIDENKPFAMVFPINSAPKFYNDDGEVSVIMNYN